MYQIGGKTGGPVKAFSIPPAIDPAIKGAPLADLTLAFAEAWNGPAMRQYADALATASVDEIERARPQIYFTANNVALRLQDESFAASSSVKDLSSPTAMIGEILGGVAKDADALLRECDQSPRNRYRLRQLAGALSYLAEIHVFCTTVARSCDPDFASLADLAGKSFNRISAEAEQFKRETAERYPEVAEIIPTAEETSAKAEQALKSMDFTLPRLSKMSARRVLDTIGDHGDLWSIANGKNRDKYIETRQHIPVDEKGAREISEGVRQLMSDFDDVFNRHGFLAELRKCAVALRYFALNYANSAHTHTEGEIRRQRKSIYDSDQEHERRIKEQIARLPQEKQRDLKSAADYQTKANMISGFLHRVKQGLADEKTAALHAPTSAFISFRKENGALVGELDIPGKDAIVIYNDHIVRKEGRHADAVYAIRMPAQAIADGVPALEEVRQAMFDKATNYHSLVECLNELDNEIERKYFFDGIRISGHDGFSVLEGEVSLDDHAPSAGLHP